MEDKKYIGSIDHVGSWPVGEEQLRAMPKYLRVSRPDDRLDVVVGEKNPYLMRFAFSTKYIHFGELILPVGGAIAAEFLIRKDIKGRQPFM